MKTRDYGGDSDSAGLIAGHIAGALYGKEAIPKRRLDAVDLRDEITDIILDFLQDLDEELRVTEYPPY